MFLGHFAVGLAAKRVVPEVSLGPLFAAAQLADLVWPNLVLAGIERLEIRPGITAVTPFDFVSYPWSHSLVALGLWGALSAAIYLAWTGPRAGRGRIAAVLALTVVSHWVLDVLSHRPDMPVTFRGERRLGFGLWSSLGWTLAVELALLAVGLMLYLRATHARDRIGRAGLGAFAAVLVGIYLASLFGPTPPSSTAVAWSAQGVWLFVLFGAWIDRHRAAAVPESAV